jgi:hypothetical protein
VLSSGWFFIYIGWLVFGLTKTGIEVLEDFSQFAFEPSPEMFNGIQVW